MKLAHPDLRSRLASEYVLGTMRGPARRRFEEYLKRDPALRAEVVRWEDHLSPLAERLRPVDPPARVWQRIEMRLDRASRRQQSGKAAGGLWQSIAFWRGVGLAATSLAAVLLVTSLATKPAGPEPILTAVLAEDSNAVRLFIEQPKANVLKVRMIRPWANGPDKAHELWVIPSAGAPRSVGVINSHGDTLINIAGLDSKLADGALFAVSIEPPGGSTTGAPTGKVVCKGTIAWLPPRGNRSPGQT